MQMKQTRKANGDTMSEHENGTMDARDHEKTFNGFVRIVGWVAIVILLFLLFLGMVNG